MTAGQTRKRKSKPAPEIANKVAKVDLTPGSSTEGEGGVAGVAEDHVIAQEDSVDLEDQKREEAAGKIANKLAKVALASDTGTHNVGDGSIDEQLEEKARGAAPSSLASSLKAPVHTVGGACAQLAETSWQTRPHQADDPTMDCRAAA